MRNLFVAVLMVSLLGCASAAQPRVDAAAPDAAAADLGSTDLGSADLGSADLGSAAPDAAAADGGCVPALADIESNLDGLLFTGESDYPISLERFPGKGGAAPTAALVAELSPAPGAATTETRDAETFWPRVVVDPTRTPPIPDARPAALRAAVESALTDLTLVRVIDPANPVEVRVYLVGRTCGALIWLASTSIET